MITTWRASLAPKSSGSLSHLLLFFFSFLMWTIFKAFTEFVTVLLLFYVLVFGPQGMWDPRSPTRARDWTRTPALEGTVLTTGPPDKSLLFFSFQVVRKKGREINLEKHDSYQHILNVYVRNTTTQLMKFINELEGGVLGSLGRVLAVAHTEATAGEQGLPPHPRPWSTSPSRASAAQLHPPISTCAQLLGAS